MKIPASPEGRRSPPQKEFLILWGIRPPRFAVEGEPPAVSDRLPRGFPRSTIAAGKPAGDNRLPPHGRAARLKIF